MTGTAGATATGERELLAAAESLDFARTVDRSVVHRRNLTEVFLTDVRPVGPHGFVAAALLPAGHPHYTGHTGAANRRLDPLLLVECCRQAETYAAHVLFDVEPRAAFVLRGWSAELFRPGFAAVVRDATSGPTELRMTVTTGVPRRVGGRVRGLDYEFTLRVAGHRIGVVRLAVGYLAPEAYTVVRSRGRGGPPPTSSRLGPAAVVGGLTAPDRVGRRRATDTVLLDVRTAERAVTAGLRVPVENISFFDHDHDHVPGMVLLEAARQVATLATAHWGGDAPDRTVMSRMAASFAAYAELDQPVTLTAVPADAADAAGPAAEPDRAGGSPRPVDVTFHQGGAEIARMGLTVAPDADGTATTDRERVA
ncbi:AfsA-related hotdog domain-containing protein [Micromonospora sp. NPDC049240]|uniref:AfsA-related hotdog domain-containing protein n=1 Tax=Micromonospora sp. NPDC049240 TaxID=3155151 RepID=UPI0033DE822F